VSTDIAALVERARAAAASKPGDAPAGTSERSRLVKVAQEFESMLLTQMLRDMRKSGAWEEEQSEDTYGADTMFETLDVELASHLAHVQGLGLSKQLLEAFDRLEQGSAPRPQGPALIEASGIRAHAPEAPSAPTASLTPGASLSPAASLSPEPRGPKPSDVTVKPVDTKVTSSFGWRQDPFTGQSKFHRGIDLKAAYGQDVRAAGDGRVLFSGTQRGYGTTVMVEHQDGTRTRYAHLSAALVSKGDAIAAGQPVGQAGHSGRATGTHVHFEVIAPNGQALDPLGVTQAALRADARGGSSGD
jgi:murein DD-endopeptidase MepM/ murein hydrolase activator NlpD